MISDWRSAAPLRTKYNANKDTVKSDILRTCNVAGEHSNYDFYFSRITFLEPNPK